MRWLKKRIALMVCRWLALDPYMFVPYTCIGEEVEVRVAGKAVWINTAAGCHCRGVAFKKLTVIMDREPDERTDAGPGNP